MPKISLYKKIGLKVGITASFILIPFLFSYAQNHEKVDAKQPVPLSGSNRPAVPSKINTPQEIKQVQTLLALLKFNPGPIDGILGQMTMKAIRTFQLDIGVPATGIIDEKLKSQLDNAYKSFVIRDQEEPETVPDVAEEKEQKPEETNVAASPMNDEPQPKKELEVNRPQTTVFTQPEHAEQEGRNLKPAYPYLNYIGISLVIAALIFSAYFYRNRNRKHAKKTEAEKPADEYILADTLDENRPEEEIQEINEAYVIEEAVAEDNIEKPEPYLQNQGDFQDPQHPGYITPVLRRKVWTRNKGQCAMCGSRTDLRYDYITPIADGGGNVVENLQLLCQKCERLKADKP